MGGRRPAHVRPMCGAGGRPASSGRGPRADPGRISDAGAEVVDRERDGSNRLTRHGPPRISSCAQIRPRRDRWRRGRVARSPARGARRSLHEIKPVNPTAKHEDRPLIRPALHPSPRFTASRSPGAGPRITRTTRAAGGDRGGDRRRRAGPLRPAPRPAATEADLALVHCDATSRSSANCAMPAEARSTTTRLSASRPSRRRYTPPEAPARWCAR